jgi:hypothetical protein
VKAVDLAGQRAGSWLVEKRVGSKRYPKDGTRVRCVFALWRCRCQACGTTKDITSRQFISGKAGRCRCQQRTKYAEGQSFARLFNSYRSNARRRKIPFEITDRDFATLISQPCFYTGRKPARSYAYRGEAPIVYNGIDRRDASIGYTVCNCVPCCFEVNRAKSDMSEAEFLGIVADIAKHRLSTNVALAQTTAPR